MLATNLRKQLERATLHQIQLEIGGLDVRVLLSDTFGELAVSGRSVKVPPIQPKAYEHAASTKGALVFTPIL